MEDVSSVLSRFVKFLKKFIIATGCGTFVLISVEASFPEAVASTSHTLAILSIFIVA